MNESHLHPHHRSRRIIRSYQARALKRRPLSAKLADILTKSFGTPVFLAMNTAIFIGWMIINSGMHPAVAPFDPYPYLFLVTFVSMEAIILTIVVLISQNRQSQIDTIRDELLLQVELITEREISKLLAMNKKLLEKSGHKIDDPELEEMLKEVDTSYIERKLEEQIQK